MTFRKFWIAWLTLGFVVELWAIVRKQEGDTLSEQVWALRGAVSGSVFSLTLFLLAGLFAWSIYHFAYEGSG